jgi:hypothetical protein
MTRTLHENDISKSVQSVELVNNRNSNLYRSDQTHQDKQKEKTDEEKKKRPGEMESQEK